jgi:PmbA protein
VDKEGIETYFSSEKRNRLELADGKIKVKSAESSRGYGLRVLHNGKLGFSYFSEKNGEESAIKAAIAISRYSKKTNFEFSGKRKYHSVKSCSNKTKELTAEELGEFILQMNEVVGKKSQHGRILIECSESAVEISNDREMDAESHHTNFTAYCEAMRKDGFGFSYYSGVEVPKDPVAIAEEAAGMCESMIGAKKIQSGKYDVVFSTEALNSMLDILLPSLSGEWKRKKISRLADMAGRKFASEKFSMYDDRTILASHASAFDAEGTPAKRIPIIENGVLKNFLYDRETAALEEISAEGSCSRASYQSKPYISASNIEISAGDWRSFEKELDSFVLVNSVHGVHTSNMTTGDFGVEASTAFMVNKGRKTATRGFIISGNIFTMLSNIIGIEKKQKVYDNLVSPAIAFAGLQIIG